MITNPAVQALAAVLAEHYRTTDVTAVIEMLSDANEATAEPLPDIALDLWGAAHEAHGTLTGQPYRWLILEKEAVAK